MAEMSGEPDQQRNVSIPLDMANDLRQWAEALAVEESWKAGSHGDNTLRAFKGLLAAAAMDEAAADARRRASLDGALIHSGLVPGEATGRLHFVFASDGSCEATVTTTERDL